MIIVAAGPAYACLTRDLLDQSVAHAIAGEKTKFAALLTSGLCVNIPLDQRYKVLSTARDAIEITHVSNAAASRGLWALSTAFSPA